MSAEANNDKNLSEMISSGIEQVIEQIPLPDIIPESVVEQVTEHAAELITEQVVDQVIEQVAETTDNIEQAVEQLIIEVEEPDVVHSESEESGPYKRLILEGGGVKGIAYIGGLRVLENKHLLNGIKQIAGSSAGGIVAALFAIGYSVDEMEKIFKTINFSKLKDDSFGFFRDLKRLFKHYGVYKGDYLRRLMYNFIRTKTGNGRYTFKQLYDDRGVELLLTGTNLNYRRTDYFHHKTTPDMEIVEAVRITMSIPLFFKSVVYDDCVYVDGGVANNYPFCSFWKVNGNEGELSEDYLNETIGMKVENDNEMREYRGEQINYEINHIIDYGENLIEMMRKTIEDLMVDDEAIKRTVLIPTKVSPTKFDLTEDEKKQLYNAGYDATECFLNII